MNIDKLLPVPYNQKSWFIKNYDTIKLEVQETEDISYKRLENNIFGINDRFLDWDSEKTGIDGLINEFVKNAYYDLDKTTFIIDCLNCAYEDSMDYQFYEMANNLNLILNAVCSTIENVFIELENARKENGGIL